MLTFHIITLFPNVFEEYLSESIIGRAAENGAVQFRYYNPRDYTTDKHRTVDDKAYGGGPGMVLMAEPIIKAAEAALMRIKKQESRIKGKRKHDSRLKIPNSTKVILLSPNGKQFTNAYADTLHESYTDIILIAGRYEGIDARVKEVLSDYNLQPTTYNLDEISIGPYVLSGGELPAMVIVDAVTRRLPGILGTEESVEERRVASSDVYTRPESFTYKGKEYRVPEVLLSGHHKDIEAWRKTKEK